MNGNGQRVLFGLGNNIDYESIWDNDAFCRLVEKHHITDKELDRRPLDGTIKTERDLVLTILIYLNQGGGGERFVSDPDAILQYASHFETIHTLGGTGVRAAVAATKRGLHPTLHLVSQNEEIRCLLPAECHVLCNPTDSSQFPHLIVQFKKGQRVQVNDIDLTAPNSNRIIFVHDPDNSQLVLNESLGSWLEDTKLFLISGFNAIHSQSLLHQRLATLSEMISHMPKGGTVFFEDACYHKPAFSHMVIRALEPYVDIFSMNEEELAYYAGKTISLLDPKEMMETLKNVRTVIRAPVLVVHTRHWALAYGNGAQNLACALRGGIAMATTRYLLGDHFTEADYHKTCLLPAEEAGKAFCAELLDHVGEDMWCEPSLAARTKNPTTIGSGDAFVGGFLVEYLSNIKSL